MDLGGREQSLVFQVPVGCAVYEAGEKAVHFTAGINAGRRLLVKMVNSFSNGH